LTQRRLTKTEILKAIKLLKVGRSSGADNIPTEAIKADMSVYLQTILEA